MDPLVKLLLFAVMIMVAPTFTYMLASRGDLDGTFEIWHARLVQLGEYHKALINLISFAGLISPIIGSQYLEEERTIVSGVLAVVAVNLVSGTSQ